jgi:hypothetical protein
VLHSIPPEIIAEESVHYRPLKEAFISQVEAEQLAAKDSEYYNKKWHIVDAVVMPTSVEADPKAVKVDNVLLFGKIVSPATTTADPPLPLQGGDTSPTENTEWDEKSFRHFIKYNPNYHRHAESSYTIRTSYGCLWRCLFCANRKWNGIKFRSVSDIERQLNYLSSNGVRNLRVIDEVFTAHPEFEALCELFSSFEWNAQDRLDMLTGQKCAVLKKNGCKRVQVGIESFDEEIRRKLNKRLSDVEIANGIRNAVEVGLQLDAFIMLGLPYDTEYTIRRTVDKALEFFGREHVRPDIFVPYAGTAIGDAPEKHNLRMLTTDSLYFSTFAFQNMYGRIVAVPKHEADVGEWEKLLFETLYELSPDIVRKTLDQPIKDWYTDYEMYSL